MGLRLLFSTAVFKVQKQKKRKKSKKLKTKKTPIRNFDKLVCIFGKFINFGMVCDFSDKHALRFLQCYKIKERRIIKIIDYSSSNNGFFFCLAKRMI